MNRKGRGNFTGTNCLNQEIPRHLLPNYNELIP
jgi:hypothetical protein